MSALPVRRLGGDPLVEEARAFANFHAALALAMREADASLGVSTDTRQLLADCLEDYDDAVRRARTAAWA